MDRAKVLRGKPLRSPAGPSNAYGDCRSESKHLYGRPGERNRKDRLGPRPCHAGRRKLFF